MKKLRINPLVVDDLKAIRDYIAEDNPDVAIRVMNEMYEQFETLRMFPGIGADLDKRVDFETNCKYITTGNYITIYKVTENHLEIYRVINRFKDFMSVLFQE
ncbi:MAG: type II toxin-antitoxin system RelE/ParE family toxin [Hungatella sp.]